MESRLASMCSLFITVCDFLKFKAVSLFEIITLFKFQCIVIANSQSYCTQQYDWLKILLVTVNSTTVNNFATN